MFGNLRRLIEAKRRLGLKRPLVTWQFLVFGFNEHEIPRAEAMAVDIGVEKLIFLPAFLDEGRYPMPESDKSLVATWKPKILYTRSKTLPAMMQRRGLGAAGIICRLR